MDHRPATLLARKTTLPGITLLYGFWCYIITLLLKIPCGGRSFPENLPWSLTIWLLITVAQCIISFPYATILLTILWRWSTEAIRYENALWQEICVYQATQFAFLLIILTIIVRILLAYILQPNINSAQLLLLSVRRADKVVQFHAPVFW